MDRQLAPGMDRLVSEDGGGVELPSLFSGIMSAAYKKKLITLEDAERALNPAIHHPERMQLLYNTATEEEGVATCLRAVLGQLVLRKLLKETPDGTWVLGDDFVTDRWLDVLEGEPDDWMRVIVWSQTSDKPSPGMLRDRAREKSRAEIRALASKLEREKGGLRNLNRKIVDDIKRDYRDRGLLEDREEYKILRDTAGRILDGRHRLAAAKELGITWPEAEPVHVESDEEALKIAIQRNRSHMFSAKFLKSLADKGLTWINTTGKREMVRLELLADHERSDSEIARIVGCSDHTVTAARRELEQTPQPDGIARFTPIDGKRKDEALRARVHAALEENSTRSNNAIGRIVGCSHHLVADVRAEMENEGTVEQYRSTRGRPTSSAPKKPKVPPMLQRTLAALQEHSPATDEELAAQTGMKASTIRGRLAELQHAGKARHTEQKRNGRIVWEILKAPSASEEHAVTAGAMVAPSVSIPVTAPAANQEQTNLAPITRATAAEVQAPKQKQLPRADDALALLLQLTPEELESVGMRLPQDRRQHFCR